MLREEREIAKKEERCIDEESEDEYVERPIGGTFLAMMDDFSSEEVDSSESEEEEANDGGNIQKKIIEKNSNVELVSKADFMVDEVEEKEDDIDAILAEFQTTDAASNEFKDIHKNKRSWFQDIVDNLNPPDLDLEFVIRINLHGRFPKGGTVKGPKKGCQNFIFGPPKEGWIRPPHYIGGGIGMESYDKEKESIPWPYSQKNIVTNCDNGNAKRDWIESKNWYTFRYSDTYKKTLELFHQIQQTGDVNALAMFIADHPFVPEALLQLSKVAYQINCKQEGLALLRRSLWIYECSSLNSFSPHREATSFLDMNRQENKGLFETLLQLIKVSTVSGAMRTTLSASRYLLSMDPLRDPTGVLLVMDYYALSTMNEEGNMFLIRMVESDKINIHYQDEVGNFVGKLTDMPNWAYSYAMALYRLEKPVGGAKSFNGRLSSTDALVSAIQRFPNIVEQLLKENNHDFSGRSMITNWPPVLKDLQIMGSATKQDPKYDANVYHASISACDLISNFFVKKSSVLWEGADLLIWLYQAAVETISTEGKEEEEPIAYYPSPALQRYCRINPETFDDRERLFPEEANPLDPMLLEMSLVVDPNRRRMLRPGGNRHNNALEALENQARNEIRDLMIGQEIDPDSPMLEELLQGMLAGNHLEGLPPPNR